MNVVLSVTSESVVGANSVHSPNAIKTGLVFPREDSHATHESSLHTHIAWETLATVLKVPRGQLWGQAYFDVCLTS